MSLTYLQAKQELAQFAGRGGRCSTADIDNFVRKVLEYLLYSGANQDLREFEFQSQSGVFTVPYEVESIQKVKIDGRVGTSFDKWFEYRPSKFFNDQGCLAAIDAVYEQANYYSTAYNIPDGGAQVATFGTCDEAPDAHIIVAGKDLSGREIFTTHKGEQISGEYLSVKKGTRVHSSVTFGEITGIKKSVTKGYVQLLWVKPSYRQVGFLSDYSPLETVPSYRRYKVKDAFGSTNLKVSVLARIRLKEAYADSDKIPFETLFTLSLAGQHVFATYTNDLQTAQMKDAQATSMIEKEAGHKKVNNGPAIEFFQGTSPGRIRNTINSLRLYRWRT